MQKQPSLLVAVGETASGKSALALELARQFDGEIIAADSRTVYRGMDIGTAKPSKEDQKLVRHHLIDITTPDKPITAAQFKELAQRTIDEISGRGTLPILVGGTGLYIDGVIYDFEFLPVGDAREREKLNDLNQTALLKRIDELGIDASGVDIQNKRRLIRLIETNGVQPTRKELRTNTLVLGMKIDRFELESRITKRVDAMLVAGLEQEVRGLAEQYGWGCEAMKGVGYAQWWDYFSGTQTLAETRAAIIKDTLDLAKRQRTWFKRNKSIHWFSTSVKRTDIVDFVTTFLDT
ncbi:MAG: tRNA (adenosine(37)-N6)-dimethylallyltransferase MiaA [Candidatus Saccharimonadales bacterium]